MLNAKRASFVTLGLAGTAGGVGSLLWMIRQEAQKKEKSLSWKDHVCKQSLLEEVYQDKLWTVVGDYKTMNNYRTMTIYKNGDGGLILHTPLALDIENLDIFEKLGKVEAIIIPNESKISYVDVNVYKLRYPNIQVICPSIIKETLEEEIEIDSTVEEWINQNQVSYIKPITPPLNLFKEQIYSLDLNNGQKALVFGELLWNLKNRIGIRWKFLSTLGASGDGKQPQISLPHKRFGFSSKEAAVDFFSSIKDTCSEKRKVIDCDVDEVLTTQDLMDLSDETYPIMTFQHGKPTFFDLSTKIKNIIQSL